MTGKTQRMLEEACVARDEFLATGSPRRVVFVASGRGHAREIGHRLRDLGVQDIAVTTPHDIERGRLRGYDVKLIWDHARGLG